MYAQQNKKNVTYIDELPELEDIEYRPVMNGMPGGHMSMMGIGEHIPNENIPDKFKKFIRNPMGPPHYGSGMNTYNPQPHSQEFFAPPQPPQPPQDHQPSAQDAPKRPPVGSPTCLDIADHVGACPICSRFYKNDNTVYIIAIVILAIICILLLKKVLNL